jgi:tetratricopeptide (TPR) repeat protein
VRSRYRYRPGQSFQYVSSPPVFRLRAAERREELPQFERIGFQGKFLKRYSFGFDNLIADLIWIQLIQEASHEPVKSDDLSWEYAQVDAVTALDHRFTHAYSFGAVFVSIFRQDIAGAEKILRKWVKRQPRNWRAHYMLGFHYYDNVQDYEKASHHVLQAATLPKSPSWLVALGVRLLSETGSLTQALRTSVLIYPIVFDKEGKKRLIKRIRALNFGLQKAMWNSALTRYREKYNKYPQNQSELLLFFQASRRQLAALMGAQEIDLEIGEVLSEKFQFRYDRDTRSIISHDDRLELEFKKTGIYKRKRK